MSNVVENAKVLNAVWNTLGKSEMSKWGLSGDVEFAPMESVGRLIKIKNLDIKFPPIIKNPEENFFDYYRYKTPYDAFQTILKFVARFANVPFEDIFIKDPKILTKFGEYGNVSAPFFDYYTTIDTDIWNNTSFDENGEKVMSPHFVFVDDGSYAISKKSAIVYPVWSRDGNWAIVDYEGYHLSEIENDDWWDALSAEDRAELERYFG